MRGLIFFIVGLFALFALLRAYTDVKTEKQVMIGETAVKEASVKTD